MRTKFINSTETFNRPFLYFFTTFILLAFSYNFTSYAQVIHKFVATDRGMGDYFGQAICMSDEFVIVGAYLEDENVSGIDTKTDAGSAYIFKYTTSSCTQLQKIVASDRNSNDYFGLSVSISGDYAIIAACQDDEDESGGYYKLNSGSVYIFKKDSSDIWAQVQKLVASDRAADDNFGSSVCIDGNYAIVGAHNEDHDASGGGTNLSSAGSAYIFKRDSSGVWVQVQKIVASDRAASDQFGVSVSVSGNYTVVGANMEDDNEFDGAFLSAAGSAYLFECDTNGIWYQVKKIVASDRAADDQFGRNVSISGNYIVVGSVYEDHDETGGTVMSNAGSAYIFERDSAGTWAQKQKIVAPDRFIDDYFAYSVSISGDSLFVGALREDENVAGSNTMNNSGSAYIFARNTFGVWAVIHKVVAPDRDINDYFGTSVSIFNGNIAVGAIREDHDIWGSNYIPDAGSAYITGPGFILSDDIYFVDYKDNSNNLIVYPNPCNDNLNFNLSCPESGKAIINVTDILGKTVYKKYDDFEKGLNKKSINIEGLCSGCYFLQIVFNDSGQIQKCFTIK